MGRVRFKHKRAGELAVRRQLLGILAGNVQVIRLFPARDGVVVITNNDGDADTIFRDDIQGRLREGGFTAVMPPELKSQRTVICFGLDEIAYMNSPEEIKEELESQHSWLKIQEVYTFAKTPTVKIICTSSVSPRRR